MTRQRSSEVSKVATFARIPRDLRDAMKASQERNGRTWEGEVEQAFRVYIASQNGGKA